MSPGSTEHHFAKVWWERRVSGGIGPARPGRPPRRAGPAGQRSPASPASHQTQNKVVPKVASTDSTIGELSLLLGLGVEGSDAAAIEATALETTPRWTSPTPYRVK